MTIIDHTQVGWMGPVSVLEFLLLALWVTGLLLGHGAIFRHNPRSGGDAQQADGADERRPG